jgi:hypothetical protein
LKPLRVANTTISRPMSAKMETNETAGPNCARRMPAIRERSGLFSSYSTSTLSPALIEPLFVYEVPENLEPAAENS